MLYETLGQYGQALPLYQRALAINEKALGSNHIDTALSLNRLGGLYRTLGQYDQAIPLLQRALAIREKVLGPNHASTALSLNNLAALYQTSSQYDKALSLLQRALLIEEKVLGPEHADTASSLSNLAELYKTLSQYDKALPLHQRALAIREKTLGPEHVDTAHSLNNLAALYQTLGQYDKALPLYQRALTIQEKVPGAEHTDTATSLNNLATLNYTLGQYDKALPLYQRALAIREKILGPEHADTAISRNNLAILSETNGQYDKALPQLLRALADNEKTFGPDHVSTALSLNNLAGLYKTLGQYDKALPLLQRALAIREKVLGPEHADTANSLGNLADLYGILGQYNLALPLNQRALAIQEKIFGPDHPDTAGSLSSLATEYQILGQYDKALTLHQRALAIREKVLGSEHADIASSLNHLAILYSTLGQYDQALPLYRRALAIKEKVLGPDHIDTAASLNNLAGLYKTLGQYDKVLPLLQRALAICERVLGTEHASTATSLTSLAGLYKTLGQYDKALPLLQRALAIRDKIFGPEHDDTALSLNNLAELYKTIDQYDEALPLYQRAYRSALFVRVPDILKLVQGNLGYFYARQGNASTAIFYLKGAVNTMQSIRTETRGLDKSMQKSLLKKNEDVYKELASLLVDAGRLAEAQQVLSMLKEDEYFDFIRRDANADARGTRINYNGTEKTFTDLLDKLGNDGVALVGQLNVLNKQAKLGLTPEQEKQRARIKSQLSEQAKQTIALLNNIAQQLPTAKKQQLTEVGKENLDQLRATLTSMGHGAVLLSYIVTDKHVLIILTTPQKQLFSKAEISATELNNKINAFRRVLQNPTLDPRPQAQEMYQLLIAPVANDLKQANAQTLMFSLDGSLRYLPMGALHDGEVYLAEHYPIAMYTEVAKDKLREKPKAQWKVAGLGITRKIGEYDPLPSVRQELDGIIHTESWWKTTGGVLPGDIYLNEDFTQARLHDVLDRTYPVLHIASHFVFIPGTESQSFLLLGDGKQLSLAELRTSGWNFGSVDMMTLSACETALGGGHDENGREIEGFGALVQRQGAKGVLATLWPVADQSTAILMQSLYRFRQEKGLTKTDALREAQLTLISGKHSRPAILRKIPIIHSAEAGTADAYPHDPAKPYAHPYYWAPFILMGNWL